MIYETKYVVCMHICAPIFVLLFFSLDIDCEINLASVCTYHCTHIALRIVFHKIKVLLIQLLSTMIKMIKHFRIIRHFGGAGYKFSSFLKDLKFEANFHSSDFSLENTNEQQFMSSSNLSTESFSDSGPKSFCVLGMYEAFLAWVCPRLLWKAKFSELLIFRMLHW